MLKASARSGCKQGQVVVPRQVMDVRPALEQGQALGRTGVVAHQVAQVQDGVHLLLAEAFQDAFQGLQITVDVGDNGYTQVSSFAIVFSYELCTSLFYAKMAVSNSYFKEMAKILIKSSKVKQFSTNFQTRSIPIQNSKLETRNLTPSSLTFPGILIIFAPHGTRQHCGIF